MASGGRGSGSARGAAMGPPMGGEAGSAGFPAPSQTGGSQGASQSQSSGGRGTGIAAPAAGTGRSGTPAPPETGGPSGTTQSHAASRLNKTDMMQMLRIKHGSVVGQLSDNEKKALASALTLRKISSSIYFHPPGTSLVDLEMWYEIPGAVGACSAATAAFLSVAEGLNPAKDIEELKEVLKNYKDGASIGGKFGVQRSRLNEWQDGWRRFSDLLEGFVIYAATWRVANQGKTANDAKEPGRYGAQWWPLTMRLLHGVLPQVWPSESLGLDVEKVVKALTRRIQRSEKAANKVYLV